LAGNGTQEGDSNPAVVNDTPAEGAVEQQTSPFQQELQQLRPESFQVAQLKVEPTSINTGDIWGQLGLNGKPAGDRTDGLTGDRKDEGTGGDVLLARLEPERKSSRGNEEDPVKARIIEKGTEEVKRDAPFYKEFIREMNAKIHEGIKNGDPKALAAEVSRFFGTLQNFENSNLPEGIRKDSFIANAVSGATLDQFGETLAGETVDGKPVSIKYDEHARNMSITIGQGTSQESTMTIDAQGRIEMKGPIQNQSDFLKKLKPYSGGTDTV